MLLGLGLSLILFLFSFFFSSQSATAFEKSLQRFRLSIILFCRLGGGGGVVPIVLLKNLEGHALS